MNKYTQLTEIERARIFEGQVNQKSIREIAAGLGRSPSTISRERRRNSDHIGYLYPRNAHENSLKRKARHGSKIMRIPGLLDYIKEKLDEFWAPIAIAGRWSKDNPGQAITAETVYHFIYSPAAKKLELWKKLPRQKVKRGLARITKKPAAILNKTSIHERPESINTRNEPGHFEGDLFFNRGSMSSNTLNLIERKSRFLFLAKNSSKDSVQMADAIRRLVQKYAQTITVDNGTEFAAHQGLAAEGIKIYFCDPHSPWQKGSVENANGYLRRFVPFRVSAEAITQDVLDRIANLVNNIPRKSLNFLTPKEVFFNDFNLNSLDVALQN